MSVTDGWSPVAVPDVPLNVGRDTLSSPLFTGVEMWTAGGVVSTVKLTGSLRPPGLPVMELGSVACAVYCPSFSADVAAAEVQAPATGAGAVAFVPASKVPKGLKTLKIDGHLPSEKEHPLR